MNVLIDKHFGKIANNNLITINQPGPSNINEEIYNSERVHKIVTNLSPFKAPGPGGIQAIHIQKIIDLVDKALIHIMKASHTLQIISQLWQKSKGIFLVKPGKTDYNNPKSFRTITLTSTLLKIQGKVHTLAP